MQTMDLNIILNKKNSAAEMKIIFQISKFKTNVLFLILFMVYRETMIYLISHTKGKCIKNFLFILATQ